MLKKANRLKSRGDFKRTLAGRRLWINDCFIVYGLAASPHSAGPFSAENMQPRIGFIVSKKIHKKSVRRNRIKRKLRELVRLSLLTPATRAVLSRYRTLVLIARTGSLEATYQVLEQKLQRCLHSL